MAGYPLPQFHPTQQLNQTPQAQTPPAQPAPTPQAPPTQQAPPQQADPLEQVKQSLANQYTAQQQNSQVQGGAIKRLLGNFLQGAGSAMMQHVGLPTPYEQQQKTLSNLQGITNTQAMLQLHAGMASMYGSQPVQMPDGSTQMVPNNQLGRVLSGLMQSRARQKAAETTGQYGVERAIIGQGIPVNTTPEMQQMGLPPRLPLKQAGQAQQLLTRPLQTVQGEQGPAVINKLNPGAPPVQIPGVGNPRAMFAPGNRYVPVVDPDNPDNVTYMPAAQAARAGAASPQSVGFQANKAITKSATSGPIGTQLSAFNTALQHADLLRQAARALNNGDTRALNSISNQAASQFGDPALTTAQAIAGAYTREITSMLSKGHLTDAEIGATGATMPLNANYKTIDSVLGAYEKLARSKIGVLRNQVTQGKQGQPAFGAPASAGGFAAWKASQGR